MGLETQIRESEYFFQLALPGVAEADVDVQIHKSTTGRPKVVIKTTREKKGGYGLSEQVVPLPRGLPTEHVITSFAAGVLVVRVPIKTDRNYIIGWQGY
jgi:HSP20 family molecular chaperone IbpA